jgi:CHAD domain-containing protein
VAYRLKRHESARSGLKRIAREELGEAIGNLRGNDGPIAVHEARKHLKKVRALLRLVKREMGGAYREENARLRDIGRILSPVRDAEALIEAVNRVKGRRPALRAMGRALRRHKREVEQQSAIAMLAPKLAGALEETRKRIRSWPLEGGGFGMIEHGIETAYRSGRKALQRYRDTRTREDLHEWRKRVKDHWYHIRLLQNLGTNGIEAYERQLKEMEDALGEHLNLSMLRDRDALGAEEATREIDAEQQVLLRRALEVGQRTYAEKPKPTMKRLRRMWR